MESVYNIIQYNNNNNNNNNNRSTEFLTRIIYAVAEIVELFK